MDGRETSYQHSLKKPLMNKDAVPLASVRMRQREQDINRATAPIFVLYVCPHRRRLGPSIGHMYVRSAQNPINHHWI